MIGYTELSEKIADLRATAPALTHFLLAAGDLAGAEYSIVV